MWSFLISGTIVLNILTIQSTNINDNKAPLNQVSERAIVHFKQTFRGTSDERWTVNEGGYRVSFVSGSVKHVADYQPNGQWRNTIRFYDESLLPAELRRNIKASFPDSEIISVNEVQLGNTLAYFVKIQQDGWTKTIQVIDNGMAVIEEFREQ